MKNRSVRINSCVAEHLPAILEIFNDAILNSTALYEYKERTMDFMIAWYDEKLKANFPVIGAFDENNRLLGFATYGMFRVRPAYKYTVEHSVYVRYDARGLGVGKLLLQHIVSLAQEQQYHTLIGVIDDENKISKLMHEKQGFVHVGTMQQVGYKFGKWLDAAFYQLVLATPTVPNDN